MKLIDIDIDAISNGFAGVKNDAGEVVSTQTDIAEVTIVESTRLTLVQDAPFQGVEKR